MSIIDPKITLVEEQGKRHSQVEILDTRMGVLARPSARIFPPLYEDQLAVHIGSDTGGYNKDSTYSAVDFIYSFYLFY